jgi:hypothetical protein
LSKWYSLESVPKDGRDVMFWVQSDGHGPIGVGDVVLGSYDSILDCYYDGNGDDIEPICWRELPSGPASADDISFEAEEQ